ncbi:MAG: DUF2927 domain-containing protein [Cypionkella sp.]
MRLISMIALTLPLGLATACVSPPPVAQVSKNYPTDLSNGIILPSVQAVSGPVAPLGNRSNTELARDFLDLAFRMESGRALPVLSRFESEIVIAMMGDVPPTAPIELAKLITRYRSEAGLNVRTARKGEAPSVTIEFVTRHELQKSVPSAACFTVPRVRSFAEYKAKRNSSDVDWATVVQREHAIAFIPSDTSPQEVRDCLHEEVSQAMGPLNDLFRLPDSIFNDDNFNTVLTSFDMLMLRLHYSPELQSGMNEAEVARRLPELLARLHPAGRSAGGSPPQSMSPRGWINSVEAAFGPSGSPASRSVAAQRMLSIALAQGWQDGRLAFSYFAVGRAAIASDPENAVRAFGEAGRIYRSKPGMAIHAAHCDMQLAAIALSSGQNEQAIAMVDRALPMAKSAQNAALTATLMLIKAQALDNSGQAAAAKSLRLDSLGWARYGFGSEQQLRARMAEVSSLGARGRRG